MKKQPFHFIVLLALSLSLEAGLTACPGCDIDSHTLFNNPPEFPLSFEHAVYLPADESEFVDEYVAPSCQAGCEGCRQNNPREYN